MEFKKKKNPTRRPYYFLCQNLKLDLNFMHDLGKGGGKKTPQ